MFRHVLCDLYGGINSKEFKDFLKSKDIIPIFTTPDAAQSNGLVERVNQTLSNKIRCLYFDANYKKAWSTIAHEAVKKYNLTPHSVTGYPPAYLLNGQQIQTSINENPYEPVEQARQIAFDRSQRYHNVNKDYYDAKRQNFEFQIGDLAFIKNKNHITRKKTEPIFIGPFKVIEKTSSVTYIVQTSPT